MCSCERAYVSSFNLLEARRVADIVTDKPWHGINSLFTRTLPDFQDELL